MLRWALTAAALLTFLYAVRVVFLSGKDSGHQREKLGCAFGLVAAGLWAYVLGDYLGSFWPGVRVGLGLLLVLPAVQALAKPKGGPILRGVVGLILAILIAGPVVQDLWGRYGPDGRPSHVVALENKISEMRDLLGLLEERERGLSEMRSDLRAEIAGLGASWEELQGKDEAMQRLEVLRKVEEQLSKLRPGLVKLRDRIPLLEAQLAEVERTSEEPPEPEGDPVIDALMKELEAAPELKDLSIVEQYAREKELQALYEEEF